MLLWVLWQFCAATVNGYRRDMARRSRRAADQEARHLCRHSVEPDARHSEGDATAEGDQGSVIDSLMAEFLSMRA
jgi:hypothetical protein